MVAGTTTSGISCPGCGGGTAPAAFCAEHSAIAESLKARESEIDTIAAVCGAEIVPSCGRCRELIRQIGAANGKTRIIVPPGHVATLSELPPFEWSVSPDKT